MACATGCRPARRFIGWITQLFALRRRPEDPTRSGRARCRARGGERSARECGTVAVGDISNSLASVPPIAQAGLRGLIFHELLGFGERDGALIDRSQKARDRGAAQGARISIAPHAPYSTSPELFRAIRAAVDASDLPITSVHLGESPEEMEMLAHGTGAWPGMLKVIGVWRDDWPVPRLRAGRVSRPARGVSTRGRSSFTASSSTTRRSVGWRPWRSTLVTCPRSNQWVGVGVPPVERFYRSGVAVAIGTDSLASVDDLNLFSELKTMRWLAPAVPARELLKSATIVGARALGLDVDLGTLAPGKLDAMIAVELPEAVGDVEEYLVNGIEPSQIRPLGTSGTVGTLGTLNPVTRLSTYLSFVRFSHSVFALPFALTGALLASRHQASGLVAGDVDRCRDGGGAQRRDGLQSAGRRAIRRPQPAHGRLARLPRGAMSKRRSDDVRGHRVSSLRLCIVAAESALRAAVAGRARHRLLVLAGQALHQLHTSLSWSVDGGGTGRRLAGRRRARRVGTVAARASRSACGSAASTFSMRVRTWTSIDRTACARFRCDSEWRARSGCRASSMSSRSSAWRRWHGSCRSVRCISLASRVVAVLLFYEQSLVSQHDLSQVKRAFDLNGWVGIVYFLTVGLALYVS